MASETVHWPEKAENQEKERNRRGGCQLSESGKRGGWRREKLRQGLLTDSDGYHFIRDTILRLPQPTRSPSPSPMPPTTDLIWSEPTRSDPLLALRISAAFFLDLRPLFFSLVPQRATLCLPCARVAYFYRQYRHVRTRRREEKSDYDSGIEHRSRPHCRSIVLERYTPSMEVSCKFGRRKSRPNSRPRISLIQKRIGGRSSN